MYLSYECVECGSSYRVSKMDDELHLLMVVMSCPESCCSGEVRIVEDPASEPKRTTAKILFEACMGKGFPAERKCSPEALRELLVGAFITYVDVEDVKVDQDRSIIQSMSVGVRDGKSYTVHFAMSNNGATIYKVIQDG
jgi:hypothetical protein